MSEPNVPYIKRLENQRDVLIKALKASEAYDAAMERANTTAYRFDALKAAKAVREEKLKAISDAKTQLGGLYA